MDGGESNSMSNMVMYEAEFNQIQAIVDRLMRDTLDPKMAKRV